MGGRGVPAAAATGGHLVPVIVLVTDELGPVLWDAGRASAPLSSRLGQGRRQALVTAQGRGSRLHPVPMTRGSHRGVVSLVRVKYVLLVACSRNDPSKHGRCGFAGGGEPQGGGYLRAGHISAGKMLSHCECRWDGNSCVNMHDRSASAAFWVHRSKFARKEAGGTIWCCCDARFCSMALFIISLLLYFGNAVFFIFLTAIEAPRNRVEIAVVSLRNRRMVTR